MLRHMTPAYAGGFAARLGVVSDDSFVIVPMDASQAQAVLAIYQAGIDEGDATFETVAPTWAQFDAARLDGHRFVAVDRAGVVLGWVAVSPVSRRPAYVGVVEHSVYVDPAARGRGVGAALLRALIASTEAASLALHERHGFRVVGVRERIGRHHSRWRDVVLLERRSPLV